MNAVIPNRILAVVVAVVLAASAAGAAQLAGSLSGPVLGYVFDRKGSKLRPVRGILGSATIGMPIDTGVVASQILILDANRAIASTDAPELVVLHLDATAASSTVLSGVPANPSHVAASLTGASAGFYYFDTKQVLIVTGLSREPHYFGRLSVDSPVTQMAINDEGTLLVYAVTGPDGEVVYSWSAPSGSPRFLTSAVSVSGIAITRNGDAIVTDRGANEVFAIGDAGGGAVRRILADAAEGVSNPTGIAVSSSNRIYIANSGSGAVLALDSNGRFLNSYPCNCTVSGVYPLRDSVFRLTERTDQTIFLLDASSAEERILFVPPPQE